MFCPKNGKSMAENLDIRMNQLPTATDGAYIYAEAADGSQVKIAKSDLAILIRNAIIQKNKVETNIQKGEHLPINEVEPHSIYLLTIQAIASNIEYSAVYVLHWASVYAASVNKLSDYNYTDRISVTVSRVTPNKFSITFTSNYVTECTIIYCLTKIA